VPSTFVGLAQPFSYTPPSAFIPFTCSLGMEHCLSGSCFQPSRLLYSPILSTFLRAGMCADVAALRRLSSTGLLPPVNGRRFPSAAITTRRRAARCRHIRPNCLLLVVGHGTVLCVYHIFMGDGRMTQTIPCPGSCRDVSGCVFSANRGGGRTKLALPRVQDGKPPLGATSNAPFLPSAITLPGWRTDV